MLTTGSFAQLFIANRFSKREISSPKLKHFDDAQRKLLNSLSTQGLKQYVQNDCDLTFDPAAGICKNQEEKHDSIKLRNTTITRTLSKMMHHYPTICKSITSYTEPNHTYYHKAFNIHELVIYIFQYLNDIKSLVNCSMVDSIWLINAFHPHCTKYWELNVDKMNTALNTNFSQYYCLRQWLRFQNASSLWIMRYKPLSQNSVDNLKLIDLDNMNDIKIFLSKSTGLKLAQQVVTVLSAKMCQKKSSSPLSRLWVSIQLNMNNDKILNFLTSEQDAPIVDVSRYKNVALGGTSRLFSSIIGSCCQELEIHEKVDINTKQSDFKSVKSLKFCTKSKSTLKQFLRDRILCPQINDLTFCFFDYNVLLFWKNHEKYLSMNNGKVSLEIDVGIEQHQNNHTGIRINATHDILQKIENSGLRGCALRLQAKLFTIHGFNELRHAFISTYYLKDNLESLYLSCGYSEGYNWFDRMKSIKISDLFFDKNSVSNTNGENTKVDSLKCLFSNIKQLSMVRLSGCDIDHILDALQIIVQYAYKSNNKQVVLGDYYIHDILVQIYRDQFLVSKRCHMNKLFDLVYEIIVLIRYPIAAVFKFDIHYIGIKESQNTAAIEIEKQCEHFENKLKRDYKQPSCDGLEYQPLKTPCIEIKITGNRCSVHLRTATVPYH